MIDNDDCEEIVDEDEDFGNGGFLMNAGNSGETVHDANRSLFGGITSHDWFECDDDYDDDYDYDYEFN